MIAGQYHHRGGHLPQRTRHGRQRRRADPPVVEEVADDEQDAGRLVRGQRGQRTDLVRVPRLVQVQVGDVQQTQHRACGRLRRRQARAGHDGRLAASCSAAGPVA